MTTSEGVEMEGGTQSVGGHLGSVCVCGACGTCEGRVVLVRGVWYL